MKRCMKKLVSLVLAASFMIFILSGCSNNSAKTEDSSSAENGSSGEQSATADRSNLPVINLVMPTSGKYDNTSDVTAKINDILADKVGAKLNISWLGFGSYTNQVNLMLTSDGEADIVLLTGMPIATLVNNGQLLDLTDYYESVSADFLKWLDESYINSCQIGGRLYAIPNVINFSNEILVHANKSIADQLGMDFSDDSKIWTLDEIHDLVRQAVTAIPNVYGIVPQAGAGLVNQLNWDSLGDPYNMGVIEDHGTTGKVISITDCKEYIDFSKTMRSWYQEGLIMQDCMSNTEAWSALVPTGKAFCCFDAGAYPDGITTKDSKYYNLTIYPNWSAANCAVRLDYAIAGNTKYPELAFKVLDELYNNQDICNLLNYGIEGVNYVLNENGKADFPEGVTLETDTYTTGFVNAWVLPNMTNAYLPYSSVDNFYDILHTYDANSIKSGALGCVFDSTNVTNEYSACTNVYNKYYSAILSGAMDTDSTLATFKDELKTAGEATVIAEKQKQLDEFLSTR